MRERRVGLRSNRRASTRAKAAVLPAARVACGFPVRFGVRRDRERVTLRAAQSLPFLISLPRGCDGALTIAPLLRYGGGTRSTAITTAVDTAVAAGRYMRLGIACTAHTEEPLLVNGLKLWQVGLDPLPLDGARAQHDRPPRPRKLAVDDKFRMAQACGRGRLARATVIVPTAAAAASSAPSGAASV